MGRPLSLPLRKLPSVDAVLRTPAAAAAASRFGRPAVEAAAPAEGSVPGGADEVAAVALARLEAQAQPSLRPVFNLTGTVLHTNLGRALLADAAVEAAVAAMRAAVTLEFDLDDGRRGER